MKLLESSALEFLNINKLAAYEATIDRPPVWIFDVIPVARTLRDVFHGMIRPLERKVLYRRDGTYPVINLQANPRRYVVYRDDIDPFDDAVNELPILTDVNAAVDILDLNTRRVIPYQELSRLTTTPSQPVQEYQLIMAYVENHLQQRLPVQYVRENRWEWVDQILMRYFDDRVYASRDLDHQKERLNELNEEVLFYLGGLLQRIDQATYDQSHWTVYVVQGLTGDLRIEARGDYRVFSWMYFRETRNNSQSE